MKLVHFRTDHFEADALFIEELPARRVIDALNEPNHIRREELIYYLVQSAITDPQRLSEFRALSYGQARHAMREYLKSFPVDVPLPSDPREIL